MATKAEMAAEIKQLTGEEVNPDSYKADELEAMLKEAKEGAGAPPPDTSSTQTASQQGEGNVLAYLGPNSPAGRLVMGSTTIRRARAGEDPQSAAVKITREQFEQYGKEYDIQEVK